MGYLAGWYSFLALNPKVVSSNPDFGLSNFLILMRIVFSSLSQFMKKINKAC
jgi:hypothetical protein